MRPLYTKLEATPLRFAECARIQKGKFDERLNKFFAGYRAPQRPSTPRKATQGPLNPVNLRTPTTTLSFIGPNA